MIDINIIITGEKEHAKISMKTRGSDATDQEKYAFTIVQHGITAAVECYNSAACKHFNKQEPPRVQDAWVQDILDQLEASEGIPSTEQ